MFPAGQAAPSPGSRRRPAFFLASEKKTNNKACHKSAVSGKIKKEEKEEKNEIWQEA